MPNNVYPPHKYLPIHHLLTEERYPSVKTLAEELEVSERTVKRYVEYMKDTLNLPIEYDRSKRGYYYASPVDSYPATLVSDREFEELAFLRQWLEGFQGSFFYKPIHEVLDKVTGFSSSGNASMYYSRLPISIRPRGLDRIQPGLFEGLRRAIENRREVSFSYRKQGERQGSKRQVQPYHIAYSGNRWYLIGKCLKAGKERSYSLFRISDLVVSQSCTFEVPESFNPEKIFTHSLSYYGSQPGQELIEVVLEFDAIGADFLEESFDHPTLQKQPLSDGGVRITLKLNNLQEITAWVLHLADRVKVIAPEQLKQEVVKLAKVAIEANS